MLSRSLLNHTFFLGCCFAASASPARAVSNYCASTELNSCNKYLAAAGLSGWGHAMEYCVDWVVNACFSDYDAISLKYLGCSNSLDSCKSDVSSCLTANSGYAQQLAASAVSLNKCTSDYAASSTEFNAALAEANGQADTNWLRLSKTASELKAQKKLVSRLKKACGTRCRLIR